jgi:hypothetical protein
LIIGFLANLEWDQIGLSCFAGLAWAIRNTRNKICIKKTFPERPIDMIYFAISFIQSWKILMHKLEKTKVEELAKAVLEHARNFRPLKSFPSDVGFI